jgi:hypothetical protein
MVEIDRRERDVIRDSLTTCINGIDDLKLIAESIDPEYVQHLLPVRRHYATVLHLLDDVGWSYPGDRQVFYVTLPVAKLREWLREELIAADEALRAHAECLAYAGHFPPHAVRESPSLARTDEEAAEALEGSREWGDRVLDSRAVCAGLLARLEAVA